MRVPMSVSAVALAAALAPAAQACTIQNCVEAKLAHAATAPSDQHALATECAAAGRAGMTFQIAGWALATGHTPAARVTVRCVLYAGGTVVLDNSSSGTAAATLTGSVVAYPNIRVCATATATWADGHTTTLADCT